MSVSGKITIAVAGNPNSGKTCLFNAITGASQTVGNYPGVTVEKKEGQVKCGHALLHLVDLPGTYSLTAYSQDEVVARDYVVNERPDVIVNVVDASNLERNLYLTTQLLEMGRPLVIALNMVDIARSRGQHVDVNRLAASFGVPVVETVANRGRGVKELLRQAQHAAQDAQIPAWPALFDEETTARIAELSAVVGADATLGARDTAPWWALKLLEDDEVMLRELREKAADPELILEALQKVVRDFETRLDEEPVAVIAECRYAAVAKIFQECVVVGEEARRLTLTDRIDAVVCSRSLGLFCVALCIYLVFKGVFFFAEQLPCVPSWNQGFVWQTPSGFFAILFDQWLPMLFADMAPGPLKSLVLDGALAGVGGVMGFVPLIFVMFVFLALIEDSGYIGRIAFVLDRVLCSFGLQGRSILALIISGGIAGGCAVPGIMATRTLREEKDRLTTMLVTPFMNCGAKLPLYTILIAAFFAAHKGEMLWLIALISWTVALGAALLLRKTLVRGEQSPFVMELPPYHVPHFKSVFLSSAQRTWMYIQKAGTVILGVTVILWALMYFPRVDPAPFESERAQAVAELTQKLADQPQTAGLLTADELPKTEAWLESLKDLQLLSRQEARRQELARLEQEPFRLAWAEAILAGEASDDPSPLVQAYSEYRQKLREIQGRQAGQQLNSSVAGRLGRFLVPMSRLAGFDWQTNIALIGGFAAKEVVVSTLGTAYSLGDVEIPEDASDAASSGLVKRLRRDWTPLQAFVLMIFVMIYAPCVMTLTALWRESGSWRWPLFATAYNTAIGYILAVAVYQLGLLLKIGV
jgi:ferrous iron transport protein B